MREKSKLKIYISSFLMLFILGMMFVMPIYANAQNKEKGQVTDEVNKAGTFTNAGDVEISKTVSAVDTEKGIYNVEMMVRGKNVISSNSTTVPVYVSVVFDRSGSMCSNLFCPNILGSYGTKWENAVSGAKTFATTLLTNIPNAQISLVTFATNSKVAREFESSGFSDNLFGTPDGFTDLEAGINSGVTLLSDAPANAKKYMIIIGDGKPETDEGEEEAAAKALTAASNAKTNNKIEIYTIGYSVDSDAETLLKQIASSNDNFSKADPESIGTVLSDVANQTSKLPAGTNAIVTDTLGNNFTFVDSDDDVIVDDNKITYNVGNITEEGTTFSFNIKIDEDSSTGDHNTNNVSDDGVSVKYKDSTDKENVLAISNSSKVYWTQKQYPYVVNYYKNEVNENNLIETVEGKNSVGSVVEIDEEKYLPAGYMYTDEEKTIVISTDEDKNIIDIIYTKRDDLAYTVKYIDKETKESIQDERIVSNQTFGNTIFENAIEIDGYTLISDKTKSVTITTEKNEIVFEYEKRSDLSYRVEYYLDGVIDSSKTETYNNIEFGTVIEKYIDKTPAGYVLEKTENLPLTVGVDIDQNVVKVYYTSTDVVNENITAPNTGIKNIGIVGIVMGVSVVGLILINKKRKFNND